MAAQAFDAIIIGAGQAGPSLAGRLTEAGWTIALVERKDFGGTCVNTGCMPTKTLVASAYAAHLARRSAEYGVAIEGPIRIDMTRVKARAGERKVFKVKVKNIGDLPGKRLRVCPRASDQLVRTGDCRKLKRLRPGKSARFKFSARLRRAAVDRKKVTIRFRAKARNSRTRVSTGLVLPRP